MKEMRSKVKIPFGLPAPEFAVRIGAFFIGTESSLLLDSTNIYPERLLNAGFKFKFGDISTAISDLVSSK
jgi:NAD dependent epimerase/dehydratase family enzyme